jgi:hypothetical protein
MAYRTEAATLHVSPTTGVDTGDCQLLACDTIQYAINKASNGDTIKLYQGTYTENTYTEAGIIIDKNLTIQGDSAAKTIVQAATTASTASNRVFTIKSNLTVSIQKMTIRHGKSPYGGGIFIKAWANVTISDSVISKNSTLYNGVGGRIFVDYRASLTLNNSTVSHNTTTGTQWKGGEGGGIFSYDYAEVTLNNSTISSNSADVYGGGIRTMGSPMYYALTLLKHPLTVRSPKTMPTMAVVSLADRPR